MLCSVFQIRKCQILAEISPIERLFGYLLPSPNQWYQQFTRHSFESKSLPNESLLWREDYLQVTNRHVAYFVS